MFVFSVYSCALKKHLKFVFFFIIFFLEANCSLKTSWMIDDTHSIALLTYSLIQIFFLSFNGFTHISNRMGFFSVVKNCTGKLRNKKKFQLASRFFERLSQAKSMIHIIFFHSCWLGEKKVNWIWNLFLSILVFSCWYFSTFF